MNKKITIVIISHKSKGLVTNFIKKTYNKFNTIVIDNSNDTELKNFLNKNYPNTIIKIIENNGYGSAINYASTLVKTDYFLICNPDINELDEKKIIEFENVAKKLNDKFCVLGPRYKYLNEKSIKQSNKNKEISEMKFISGACMFFKKEIFDLLGGFDEKFFLYFEESDFCLRASKINKNYQINTIQIEHNIGTSVSTNDMKERKKLDELYTWHFMWSKYYYYKKNYGTIFTFIYFLPIYLRIVIRIIFHSLFKKKEKYSKYKIRLDALTVSFKGLDSFKRLKNIKD